MKLKKLINTLQPKQAIRLVATINGVTQHSEIIQFGNGHSIQSAGDCKVLSIRSIHDDLQLPDYQDYIEIKIKKE